MSKSEQEYLLARAASERATASNASDEIARQAHERLAHEYEVQANVDEVARRADNDVIGMAPIGGQLS